MQITILNNSQKALLKALRTSGFLILALTLSAAIPPVGSLAAEPAEQVPGSTADNVRPAAKLQDPAQKQPNPSPQASPTSSEPLSLQTEHTLPAADGKLPPEEAQSKDQNPADPWQVHLRSAIDTSHIPQRPPLDYIEDTPVQVKIISTGIGQKPSWYRRDVNAPAEKSGVKVNLSSPLAMPVRPNQ